MKIMDCLNLTLTTEQLRKVEECGKNMMPPSEVPFVIGCDEFLFREAMQCKESDVRIAYMRGFAETSFKIHETNREIAEAGSPAAVTEVMRSHAICLNELNN